MKDNPLKYIILFFSICLFTACEKKVPDGVIPPGEMEEVLYDYHLAQAALYGPDGNVTTETQLMDAFYTKHHITQADFDSSMVWYTRHIEVLQGIYASLDERYAKQADLWGVNTARTAAEDMDFSAKGDTAEIWNMNRLQYLCVSPLKMNVSFSIPADTSFYQKDMFKLQLSTRFLKGKADDVQDGLTIGLEVRYANDSVSNTFRNVSSAQNIALVLRADSALNIKAVTGFLSLNSKKSSPVLLENIRLYRFHTQDSEKNMEVPDTVETLQPNGARMPHSKDSDSLVHPARLSPKQLRDQKPVNRTIRIRKR